MASVVRLTSPLPLAEIHRRLGGAAAGPPLPDGDPVADQAYGRVWQWAARRHMLLRRRVRVRVIADDEVVLRQRAGAWPWWPGDTCRVRLLAADAAGAGAPPGPAGTLLICHWAVPAARQAAMVLAGAAWVIFGMALAVAILADRHAGTGGRIFFLGFGGLNALAGVLALRGARRPQIIGQRFVLAWLAQVIQAST
jgi:hypothetical protein